MATLLPSTAFTVNVNAPGCVGTPLITPAVIVSPGGSFPLLTLQVGTPPNVSVARYGSPVCAGEVDRVEGEMVPAAVARPTEFTASPPNRVSEAIAPKRKRL